MNKKAIKIITLFLVISGLVFVINLISYFFRSSINSVLYRRTPPGLVLITVFLSLILIFLAVLIWRSTKIHQWMQRLFDKVEGYWGIVFLLLAGLLMDLLLYYLFILASFRPTFILLIITISFVIFKLVPETIFVCIVLMIVAIMPAALTSPYYGESSYLSSAVFLITGIIAILMAFNYLLVRRSSKMTD